jgi:hypothetical protein
MLAEVSCGPMTSAPTIRYGNECAASSVSDVDRYVIIRKLQDSISNIFPILICFSSKRFPMRGMIYRGS